MAYSPISHSVFAFLKNICVSVFLSLLCVICCLFLRVPHQSLRLSSCIRTTFGSGGQGQASPSAKAQLPLNEWDYVLLFLFLYGRE